MAHPFQEDLPYKPVLAYHAMTVKYYGKASHAAAYPWEGVNALDAAVLAYSNLSVLRQQIKPTWKLHEIISDTPDYCSVLQNKSLEQAYVQNGKRLGMEFPDKAIWSDSTGPTNFGNVSHVLGIHSYFYIGSDALNHTEQFTQTAGSKAAQEYTLRTAKVLAMTALDVIFQPGLLQQVQDDFRQTKLKKLTEV